MLLTSAQTARSSTKPRPSPQATAHPSTQILVRKPAAALSLKDPYPDGALRSSPRISVRAVSTCSMFAGVTLPIRRTSRERTTALTDLQMARLARSMPAEGSISMRSADGARELDRGTTTMSSPGASVLSSSTETTIAGRVLPGSPARAAPSATSQTSPRRGGVSRVHPRGCFPTRGARLASLDSAHRCGWPGTPNARWRRVDVLRQSRRPTPPPTLHARVPAQRGDRVSRGSPGLCSSQSPYRHSIALRYSATIGMAMKALRQGPRWSAETPSGLISRPIPSLPVL